MGPNLGRGLYTGSETLQYHVVSGILGFSFLLLLSSPSRVRCHRPRKVLFLRKCVSSWLLSWGPGWKWGLLAYEDRLHFS